MELDEQNTPWRKPSQRVGFLLSQLGSFTASRFAERLTEMDLHPSDVGILRMIAVDAGLSQRSLAERLGVGPSRVVALIDDLEQKSLVARVRSVTDRRNYELHLTEAGRSVMARMREIGSAHEEDIVSALSAEERMLLGELLAKVAESHALTPDVHPGYRAPDALRRATI